MLDNGDCTVITTPSRKNIVIDTGEEENVVTKYLLDRKIKNIDYLMISHFDSDHCKNSLEIMKRLKVKNVIIAKQAENSKEFQETIEIVRKKRINLLVVQAGDTINVDKDVYIKILWPKNSDFVRKNSLNNNSIVAKLYYKNFNILFTGDIEQIAEKQLIESYSEQILKSTVYKVPHHGSRTSSTEEFIKAVSPKISLICVGENNKFGHPNSEIIERLQTYGSKIYRTDLQGEITIKVNKNGKVKIETYV